MCSVVGCDSGRRSAPRFKLPEDPERRLEWVQFLFEVNGQRLKESSWTDITICNEHFTNDCFDLAPRTGTALLKSSAVPSLCVKSEPEEPELDQEPFQISEAAFHEDIKPCNSPTSYSEEAKYTVTGFHASPVSYSPDASNAVTSDDLNKEKAALLTEGKCIVNESCLFQLFRRKCPSCGCKLQTEKVTHGVLIILNQQCLQCDYRNQWKSQVNASVPTAEDQQLTEEVPTVFSEIVTLSDEESDQSDAGEEGDSGGVSSDGEWNPTEETLLAEELTKNSEEEAEDETEDETEEEGEQEDDSPGGLQIHELCTDCGCFFTILKPHTCEHKIKPYSCNVCGKRCVTKTSLKNHSRIHDETYDHPCKFCHAPFKTRLDKLKHEQIHKDRKDPYKCPDCPETFTTNKKRRIHLADHRTPKEYKCGVCDITFKDVHHLRRHSVVHTGLKPYMCSVCQRGFNQGSHLKSHMRVHTGERPFKCQLCDKSFNHNVSLKSHVQRYHSTNSGRERKAAKIDERASDTGDGGDEDSGNKKDSDSEFDNVKDKPDTEEEVQKERTGKKSRRSTGRPVGRPKRTAEGSLGRSGGKAGQRLNTAKSKARKLEKIGSSEEESEGEQSDCHISSDSAEKEEEKKETARKSTGRSRRRPTNDGDSDFDPEEEETKKKRYSSQSSGKRRGRPKKNQSV
ncbi:zinc finger protein 345-like isoform X3 [Etheostoma cragini]|uniref:zinc finger protein 345-like isoform X3 n=1 Tax=Etheostoma cragini TaxID=417921 RepID=UPI00155EA63E|nr:zinc finger protein 345-like isoform X3 [Etheostoma cragini]